MYYNDKLTIEKINQSLKELFESHPIPRFHSSVEKELNEYLKEHLDEFYFMDYSSGMGLVNVVELERILKEYDNKI